MSWFGARKDCEECNTPDVKIAPIVGGELYGECPNCKATVTDFDRDYQAVDLGDESEEGEAARRSNKRRGFFW